MYLYVIIYKLYNVNFTITNEDYNANYIIIR